MVRACKLTFLQLEINFGPRTSFIAHVVEAKSWYVESAHFGHLTKIIQENQLRSFCNLAVFICRLPGPNYCRCCGVYCESTCKSIIVGIRKAIQQEKTTG